MCLQVAEDVLKLLNSRDKKLKIEGHVEIRKQSALEEAEKPDPEPRDRTLTVSKLTEGLGLIDDGVEVVEDTEWGEKRAAATGKGVLRLLAWCEEELKEKKRSYLD
jgi:hypothetical protein